MTPVRHRVTAATATSIVVAAIAAGCGTGDDGTTSPTPSSTPATTITRPGVGSSRYRDGEYKAKGWYGGHPSSIDVALTLRAGRITEVQVTPNATNPTSRGFQERFAAAVPGVVVGKPIAEVRVSRVARSSGTPDGFNDALEKIRSEASR